MKSLKNLISSLEELVWILVLPLGALVCAPFVIAYKAITKKKS